MKKKNKFYVYVYLDPRQQGEYCFENYNFSYKPFYIGKGGTERQLKRHLYESKERTKNLLKYNKIQKILKKGLKPIVLKIEENLSEEHALSLENKLIKHFGRINIKTGFLTNLIENSTGGKSNPSIESRKKMGDATRGKTYEEIYGEKKSKELKNKRSESNRKRTVSQKLKNKLIKRNSKKWIITNPDGDEFIIENLKLFCQNNNLTTTLMWNVAKNKQLHHKGWKCKEYCY
jgi:hypothetical protein